MTIENRKLISLDEIVALEFRCANCKATVSIPVGNSDALLYKCPLCFKQNWFHSGSIEEGALKKFKEAVVDLSRSNNEGCRFRVELKDKEHEG